MKEKNFFEIIILAPLKKGDEEERIYMSINITSSAEQEIPQVMKQ